MVGLIRIKKVLELRNVVSCLPWKRRSDPIEKLERAETCKKTMRKKYTLNTRQVGCCYGNCVDNVKVPEP